MVAFNINSSNAVSWSAKSETIFYKFSFCSFILLFNNGGLKSDFKNATKECLM